MAVKIDQAKATRLLEEAVELAESGSNDLNWQREIQEFSRLCLEANLRTHVAFLGTAILAKATNPDIDPFSVKANDASPGAYSARGLCHGVLVPLSTRLGFDLGARGREPLNNQPYFRIKRFSVDIPARGAAQPILHHLNTLLARLSHLSSEQAFSALQAFITVRQKFIPSYPKVAVGGCFQSLDELVETVNSFVKDNSEGGRRAQAVVAGLLDVLFTHDRVDLGHINDPDRHLPGDIGIHARDSKGVEWERVFEVRDKPVSTSDLLHFSHKVATKQVSKASLIAIHQSQLSLNIPEARLQAQQWGVHLKVYIGWTHFVRQVLFWSERSAGDSLHFAAQRIRQRLIDAEVLREAVVHWDDLTGATCA